MTSIRLPEAIRDRGCGFRYALGYLVMFGLLHTVVGCATRTHIWWEARALGSITITGHLVTSERLGIEKPLGVKAVPVKTPPAFRPWLPQDFQDTANTVIDRPPTRSVSRDGRTVYSYPFVLRVPSACRVVTITERSSLLGKKRRTTSPAYVWQPGGYRVEVDSWQEEWEWVSDQVFYSDSSGVELLVDP